MSLARNLFTSSLGKKYLMALTGLALIGFVTGHLVGNLQIFSAPDKINGYAHFLQGLGPALWAVRLGLLAIVGIHIWAAVKLTLENNAARPVKYEFKHTIRATLASTTMRLTGLVVLAFIAYHIAHFTLGAAQAASFKSNFHYVMGGDYHVLGFTTVKAGTEVHDVHTMMVYGFQNVGVSIFYIVAVGLLSFHLWHGFESAFQSLGLRTSRWGGCLQKLTRAFCILYFLGNLAIPTAILAGVVKPHANVKPAAHAPAANH